MLMDDINFRNFRSVFKQEKKFYVNAMLACARFAFLQRNYCIVFLFELDETDFFQLGIRKNKLASMSPHYLLLYINKSVDI